MRTFNDFLKECSGRVKEIFPWDLAEELEQGKDVLILDVREPWEFDSMHIEDSLSVPRGILETAAEWDYEETVPELVEARETAACWRPRSSPTWASRTPSISRRAFGDGTTTSSPWWTRRTSRSPSRKATLISSPRSARSSHDPRIEKWID